jgi:CHAT domain
MSGQVVIQIAKGWNDQTLLQLVRAPNVGQDDVGITLFQCNPAALPGLGQPGAVQQHGMLLLSSLRQSHPRVSDALTHALSMAAGSPCPIYVQLTALPSAEVFCWEALCNDTGDFMALDPRWQIARIAGSPQLSAREADAFEPPLRLLVVLSALGRDATTEWNAIYGAVTAARNRGLPIEVTVATGQETLQDHILTQAAGDPSLKQLPLTSGLDLIDQANALAPHLVHFFCHGTTTFAKPRLELATLTDTATSSIELDLPDLVASTGVRESWLTVLNCCESGAASRDVHSLSHSLVMRGLNAVIGMKEAVSELDAFEFSGRLYPGLFELLRTTLTPLAPGDEAVVDWATVMWAPRKGLRDRHKANVAAHEWTLPVLYVRPDVFRVKRAVPVSPEARARTQTVQDFLAALPPAQRALLEAELVAIRAGQ